MQRTVQATMDADPALDSLLADFELDPMGEFALQSMLAEDFGASVTSSAGHVAFPPNGDWCDAFDDQPPTKRAKFEDSGAAPSSPTGGSLYISRSPPAAVVPAASPLASTASAAGSFTLDDLMAGLGGDAPEPLPVVESVTALSTSSLAETSSTSSTAVSKAKCKSDPRRTTHSKVKKALAEANERNRMLKDTISHVRKEIDDVLTVMCQIWEMGELF